MGMATPTAPSPPIACVRIPEKRRVGDRAVLQPPASLGGAATRRCVLMRYHLSAEDLAWAEPPSSDGRADFRAVSARADITARTRPSERSYRWGHDIREVVSRLFLASRRTALPSSTPQSADEAAARGATRRCSSRAQQSRQAEIGMISRSTAATCLNLASSRRPTPRSGISKFASWSGLVRLRRSPSGTGGSDLARRDHAPPTVTVAAQRLQWFAPTDGQAWSCSPIRRARPQRARHRAFLCC